MALAAVKAWDNSSALVTDCPLRRQAVIASSAASALLKGKFKRRGTKVVVAGILGKGRSLLPAQIQIFYLRRLDQSRAVIKETRAKRKSPPGAPPPPPPPLLPEGLLVPDEEELELELEELLELEEDELLDDDELLELEELVYSSAPMSKDVPVGRGSPSMSAVSPVMAVPASTTPEIAEVRWRLQAEGSVNQEDLALEKLAMVVVVAPSRDAMGLFVRLLRIWPPVVSL